MILLWVLAIVMILSFIYFFMFRQKKKVKSLYNYLTMDDLCSAVAVYFKDRLYIQKRSITSQEQLSNEIEEKHLLKRTLEAAIAGSYKARVTIIDEIEAFLVSNAMNITSLDELSCIVFRDPKLMTSNEKFETMMYFIQKDIMDNMTPEQLYDEDTEAHLMCFSYFIELTKCLELARPLKTAPHLHGYYINDDDIDSYFDFFMREKNIEITVADAVVITSMIIWEKLFGFGPIDTLVYDNSIDEIEGGTCGADFGSARHVVSPLNSIMVSVKNKLLRLQFLRFDSQSAFENCAISLANNGEGTFTSDDGFKFTTLTDLRRVTVRRPPLADKFSFNIRKLDFATRTNQELLEWNSVTIYNTQLVQDTLQVMAWSLLPFAWSGEQGAGKTSHVNSYVDLLEPDTAVRALGNIDESQFGNRFPERDIQHLFATPRQNAHVIAAVGRRTKGEFLIVMEILDAMWGQEAINNFKSGYVGGMLTAHGANSEDLVGFLAQLLAMGQSTSSQETTKIVASVININVKPMKYGDIYCLESITEIIPRDWKIEWETINEDALEMAGAINQQKYFQNYLDPALFKTAEIVVFNKQTNAYEIKNRPSLSLCAKIFFRLGKNRRKFFVNYMKRYFEVDIITEMIEKGVLILSDPTDLRGWF